MYQRKHSRRCWSAKLHRLGTYLNPDLHIIVQVVKLSISIMRDKLIISMEMEIRGYNIYSSIRKGLKYQVMNSYNYYFPLDTSVNWGEGEEFQFCDFNLNERQLVYLSLINKGCDTDELLQNFLSMQFDIRPKLFLFIIF